MKNAKIKGLLQVFARILQSLLTASYLGAYRYYTLEPIEKIEHYQEEILRGKLIKALADFRHIKDEELSFVAKAAALSAAAVIGVFSWPTTEKTVWAAKMLWNWSFFMSTFSLVGSAPTRLLRHLPDEDGTEYNEHKIQMALNLFLQSQAQRPSSSGKMERRQISRRMLWVWQCPAMLMSYSWVFCKQEGGTNSG
ncbi:uncharacterized protein BDR25DRAFT_304343 [Lindgomyces ingoldianus]|uniref:Uncharacterized protein n=1 Tax=Lindgomyces ingoldianus TaxID=673940 RepID=A0ACB6QTW6_9PLEO|nr:uncharacterized protein BDR25DRAFT_304343 [Lindgomyces ingoldianus]KAF2469611.1 hypothetical protein BDR25DRAFT_304343 [Lindgomyces ingoldianus]